MLNDTQIQGFRTALEKERALLEKELSSLGKRDPSNPSDWVPAKAAGDEFGADRNDNADIFEDMQDANATINELEGRLNTVTAALEKMDTGTYGVCEVSGEDIELDRLTANPAATTCKAHMQDMQ
jgi:RNA polymerase-binding transcription factor DksA